MRTLVNLQIALGELQASINDVQQSIRELIQVELDLRNGSSEPKKPPEDVM